MTKAIEPNDATRCGPPTKVDLQAIQQRRIEAGALRERVDQAVLDDTLANGPALLRRLAGEG